tara:strand:+ start:919 stop:1599 length:681 start_codon:yes stop_codon:yes gene_type:complete
MKSSVIIFPGSNCDRDMAVALEKFGFKNSLIWHNETKIPKTDLVVLPGGFSYGDYLRTGSIAAKSKIINEVINFANSGGLVLGICNGFQLLTESGLLPGVLLRNKYLRFICSNVHLNIRNNSKYFFKKKYKKTIELHIAHNDGCYYVNQDEIKKLEDKNQIALEYSDINGNVSDKTNPNGSLNNIAGIYNEKQNILGMMPHPERMIDPLLGGEDGSLFFKDLISNN